MTNILQTTVVGSYPQPDWLVDKKMLLEAGPPRVWMHEVWRLKDPAFLEQAQDDATELAVRDMERVGLDIVSDGEVRRESYFNRFANSLGGLDVDNPGQMIGRDDKMKIVPRVVGEIKRTKPVQLRDVEVLRKMTTKPIKITIPGPFTMMRMAKDEYYNDRHALLLAYAKVVNEEIKDYKKAGCDVVQIDEPFLESFVEDAEKWGVEGINRSLEGVTGSTVIHLCFGYGAFVKREKPNAYHFLAPLNDCNATQISIEAAQPRLDPAQLKLLSKKEVMYGVIALNDQQIETPQIVADRLRAALKYASPEQIVVAPDCGMKYMPRDVAYAKLKAMVDGTAIVRAEITGKR
jgi:5-methyltetrahydropteroyltriglutamate--homocysteine methyltransferase